MTQQTPFAGKTCVVTGASSGIGRAIAVRLSEAGGRVVLVGRDEERLAEAKADCGDAAQTAVLDLVDDDAVARFVDDLPAEVGVVVHNAALGIPGMSLEAPVSDLDRQFALNVRAPWVFNRTAMPKVVAGKGQIAFINSGAGLGSKDYFAAYCITKFGLRAYADALREEVAPQGVRVISIFPGRVDTPMQDGLLEYEKRTTNKPALLTADDVAKATVDALSQSASAEVTDVRIIPRKME